MDQYTQLRQHFSQSLLLGLDGFLEVSESAFDGRGSLPSRSD